MGLATTKGLVKQGAEVAVACRKSPPELEAIPGVAPVIEGVDVADTASVALFAERLKDCEIGGVKLEATTEGEIGPCGS